MAQNQFLSTLKLVHLPTFKSEPCLQEISLNEIARQEVPTTNDAVFSGAAPLLSMCSNKLRP